MGETRVKVIVRGPKGSEEVVMLADKGSSHTMIPRSLANQLVIEPIGVAVVELADGSEKRLDLARAELQIGKEIERVRVLVGETDDSLLGLSTLEMFGLKVNPVAQRLEPAKLIQYAVAS